MDISRIIGRCPEDFKEEIVSAYESLENQNLDIKTLDKNIDAWSSIDGGYINYMTKIGIYKKD